MQKSLRLACGLAAGLVSVALAGGWAATARADVAYGFAEQTISNITIAPQGSIAIVGALVTSSQDNATVNGSGTAASADLDAPQTFLGGAPPAGQNDFTRYAPGNPPTSPTTPPSFTRGDSLIVPTLAGNQTSVVAESFLNTPPNPSTVPAQTAGAGGTATFNFRVVTGGALTISYNFSNALVAFATGAGQATANYHFNITIKDAAGNTVFNSNTANTNLSAAAPPDFSNPAGLGTAGETVFHTGSETVTTPTLTAGAQYSMVLSNTAQTSTAVPEPGSVTLVAVSGVLTLGFGAVRRRALRRAPK